MPITFYRPRPPLDFFVDHFWLCTDSESDRYEAIVPSGTVEIVINLRHDEVRVYQPERLDHPVKHAGAVISGTYDRPFFIDTRQHAKMIGIHFKPGGAFPFLGVDVSAIGSHHVDLADLWGARVIELQERMDESDANRFSLLEAVLLERLYLGSESHAAVRFALKKMAQPERMGALSDLAVEVGLSQRRFIELFTRQVGVPPKLFCRILRFQKAKQALLCGSANQSAELALAHGYYDQSHMINEFQSFSGATPRQLLLRSQEKTLKHNHLLVRAAG